MQAIEETTINRENRTATRAVPFADSEIPCSSRSLLVWRMCWLPPLEDVGCRRGSREPKPVAK